MAPRDTWPLSAITAFALALRIVPAWPIVVRAASVNFQGGDAWYHLRLVDALVRHWPFGVTMDPYARAGGQYVPIAPLFDLVTALAAWIAGLGSPSPRTVDLVAAVVPALVGAAVPLLLYRLGLAAFDRRTALLAAALIAVVPGIYFDRTRLGFTDHHAAEAFFSVLTIALLASAARTLSSRVPFSVPSRYSLLVTRYCLDGLLPGLALGAYLLTWSSGAFLVAIVCAWTVTQYALEHLHGRPGDATARLVAPAAVVALAMVVAFQHHDLFRYSLQVASLAGTLAAVGGLEVVRRVLSATGRSPRWLVAALAVGVAAALAILPIVFPGTAAAVRDDLLRFRPSGAAESITEIRPLFFVGDRFSWRPAWASLGPSFFFGLVALVPLAWRAIRTASPPVVLVVVWTVGTLVATLGQNRFGYYLAPAAALATAWLCARTLDAAGPGRGIPLRGLRRRVADLAIVAIAGLVFYPNIPAALAAARSDSGTPPTWMAALEWMRDETPEPFGDPAFYVARYDRAAATRPPAYTVMCWWDFGYPIVRVARRVPAANPTQSGADVVARFFTATDEAAAADILSHEHARFVVLDAFHAFHTIGRSRALQGLFEGMVDWSGRSRREFYQGYFERNAEGALEPVWIFRPAYYQTMAVRLSIFGGRAAEPQDSTWVITSALRTRADGSAFREIVRSRRFGSFAEAEVYWRSLGEGPHELVGLDPVRPCVPVEAVSRLRLVDERSAGGPVVRTFEVIGR